MRWVIGLTPLPQMIRVMKVSCSPCWNVAGLFSLKRNPKLIGFFTEVHVKMTFLEHISIVELQIKMRSFDLEILFHQPRDPRENPFPFNENPPPPPWASCVRYMSIFSITVRLLIAFEATLFNSSWLLIWNAASAASSSELKWKRINKWEHTYLRVLL